MQLQILLPLSVGKAEIVRSQRLEKGYYITTKPKHN